MSGDDLLDTDAVAALLGLSVTSVRTYRSPGRPRPGPPFPQPARFFGRTPVWRRADIEAWVTARPGRTGRPRTTAATVEPSPPPRG